MTRFATVTRLTTLALLLATGTACDEAFPFGGGSLNMNSSSGDDPATPEGAAEEAEYDDVFDEEVACEEVLDACLQSAGGEDPEVFEDCLVVFEECVYERDCIDPATGDDLCAGWDDGDDWDECIDPVTGEDLCAGWDDGSDPATSEDACFLLFDECLGLGVSDGTCELALDECLAAQVEVEVEENECEIMLADCLYAELEFEFCIVGYEECLAWGDPLPPVDDESWEDPCGEAFVECLDLQRPEDECVDELIECDEAMAE